MPRIASTRPSTVRRVASALASGSLLAGSVAPVTAQDRTPLVVAQAAPAPTAPAPAASPFNAEQKAAIEAIIKEYFLKNPEAMLEIQTALEAKMEKIQSEKLVAALKDNAGDIYRRANSPIAGNPSGDVTLYQFYDLNCPFCREAAHDVDALLKADPKLKLVFVPYPVLSVASVQGGLVEVIAARMLPPEKFLELHRQIYAGRGVVDGMRVLDASIKLGLDRDKVLAQAQTQSTLDILRSHADFGSAAKLVATPAYVINGVAIVGHPGQRALRSVVASVRKCGKVAC